MLSWMLVGDGIGPEYSQNSSRVFGVEGGKFVEVAFSHQSSSILSRTVGEKYTALVQSDLGLGAVLG